MKTRLMVVSCGLVLALIIGTVSYQWSTTRDESFSPFGRKKCQEAPNDAEAPECGAPITDRRRSEIFLRKIKMHARIAYA